MDPPLGPMPPPAQKNPGTLAVDLTEDVNAKQPIPCARQKAADCSKLIQPEDERHYILDKNNLSGKGIILCGACYQYYETKRGTLRATYVGQSILTARIHPGSGGGPSAMQLEGHNALPLSTRGQTVDANMISIAVNQAQRSRPGGIGSQSLSIIPQQIQQSVTPLPHVMAGASHGSSGGRPSGFHIGGPVASTTSSTPAVFGYSQNHGLYHSERSRQSKKVYASTQALSHAGNTINLILQFGREVQAGGKTKLEIINGIQEGCDHISVDSNIMQLCALVHNILDSRVSQFLRGFALDIKTLPIRSIPGWVDLTAHRDPTSAFYYKECHVQDSKKGVVVFKKPRLPFTLALVMTANQWEDFQMYLEPEHPEPENHHDGGPNFKLPVNGEGIFLHSTSTVDLKVNREPEVTGKLKFSKPQSKRKHSTGVRVSTVPSSASVPALPSLTVTPAKSRSSMVSQTSDFQSSSSESDTDLVTSKSKSTVTSQPQKKRPRSESVQPPATSHRVASARDSTRESDLQIVRTPSPPALPNLKFHLKDAYTSPDRLRLREALMSGGEMVHEFKVDHKYDPPKHIDYYDIEPKPLDVLMEGGNRRFSIEYKNGLRGSLAINTQEWIGRGAAKTSHSALLSVFNAPSSSSSSASGLGRKPSEPVVAKRFYSKIIDDISVVPKVEKVKRYGARDDQRKVEAEANLLYWANSLMSLANSWIEAQIALRTNNGDPCPLTIPRLRFVHGGVASVQAASGCNTSEPGKFFYQPQATYLIEEVIPSALGDFIKYVHNVDPTPQLPSFAGPAYEIAEFLCFVQHLQYWKTDAMVYISDFQGAGHLLTDPQIMTNPSFGNFLFGDGNITEAFNKFPVQHICNKYCEWFELPPLPLAARLESLDVQAE